MQIIRLLKVAIWSKASNLHIAMHLYNMATQNTFLGFTVVPIVSLLEYFYGERCSEFQARDVER